MNRRRASALVALVGVLLMTGAAPAGAAPAGAASGPGGGFVARRGADLLLDGKAFRFAGTNNYYLMYKSRTMVDDVFADAQSAGFTVLRTWGFLDIGNADDSGSVAGKADGVYFRYWDGQRPAYNDGPDGLQRLDYVLYAARRAGIKLVIPLTNNWRDFGGMDQYVRWRGAQPCTSQCLPPDQPRHHDDFYTDPVIRGWYQDWISHVLNRVNSLTGLRYADDPTVMTWELGNEPRCKGSGVYPTSPGCATATVTGWADEMTRYIKTIDRRHLTSVGDEGFFCDDPTSADWTVNCGEGVDSLALTRLPAADVMSYHLYPDGWGFDAAWGTEWIKRHNREARRIGKPVMLGEFGFADKAARNPVYQAWTDAFIGSGGNGFLYWILSGVQDDGTPYPDYDGFTVYCPSPVCTTISNAGEEIAYRQRSRPPVADHDSALTQAGVAVTLNLAANDIAYRTKVRPGSIDLDPASAGQQWSASVPGGTFTLDAAGTVTFTPAKGFQGRASGHYTIRDEAGRTSNVADLALTVQPAPGDPILIASWESGTEGWAPGNWQTDAGTVAQTAGYHTNGSYGLHVAATGGGWFGVGLPSPVDLSAKSTLRYDLRTTAAAGTSSAIALQTGTGLAWCQSTFDWVPESTETTVVADLLSGFSCDPSALSDVRGILIWVSPGNFDLDNLRAE